MTDTYVEKLIIKRFLETASICTTAKCYQYFNENKALPDESCLPAFVQGFKPVYPDGATEEEKAIIDGDKLELLIEWFTKTYPSVYETEDANGDDDDLFIAISDLVLSEETTKSRRINIKTTEGNKTLYLFPDVFFQNISDNRPVDDSGMNSAWYELYFIPSAPNQIELGSSGRSRWVGVMQINICIPTNIGTDELYARYDEVAAQFRCGLILQGVRIVRTYRTSAVENDDYYMLPVTIEWQSDLDR